MKAARIQYPELARALHAKRRAIAHGLIESVRAYPRWNKALEGADADTFVENHLVVFVDYMIKAFAHGDEDYLSLYAGEKLKQRYDRDIDPQVLAGIFAEELAHSRNVFCANVAGTVSAPALKTLAETLDGIENSLTSPATKSLKVLWIADCLYLDIHAFLQQKAAAMQLSLDITLVTTKNAEARRHEIHQAASGTKFDVVFYSPLTYEFNLDFMQFQNAKAVLTGAFDQQRAIDLAIEDVTQTLDCIVQNVECDVFVHNASNLIRSENSLKDRARVLLTSKARKLSRDAVNQRMCALIARSNEIAFGSVRQIDEVRLVEQTGEWTASQYLHKSALQHPARLGALLANVYADIIFVESHLKPIKLVVADLDNTLWRGTIGEGEVSHFHDRQATLRVLKEKGILLAVNSKNDPKNVHWRGGTLDDTDFVSRQINWDPKHQNMLRIQNELNLNLKSFLFIDDRAEEREMIRLSFPEVTCLDAESPDTWRRLALWSDVAKNSGDVDRTLMYQQRAARETFSGREVDTDALMGQLDLAVRVREARQQELPRVTELINRTTQFNCCDSRVTFRDIQSRSRDRSWKIYIADATDRFGDMGIVSVLVARVGDEIVEVDAFVLSCRVFGFGMETAVLKRLTDDHQGLSVCGRIVETPANGPCRGVFRDHGFADQSGNVWVLQPKAAIAVKPWLKVA